MARFAIDDEELAEKFVIRQQYDPQHTFWNVLRFRGTVWEMVLTQRHFWVLVITHTLVFLGWKYASDSMREEIHEFWNLNAGYFSSLGSLVVFLIVFYTGNCYALYKELFDLGIGFRVELIAIATQMKGGLHSGEQVWDVVRCFLAAQRVYYYELKVTLAKHYGIKDGEEGHPVAWREFADDLVERHILTDDEAEMLMVFNGDKPMLLACWAVSAYISFFKSNPRCMPLGPNLGFAIGRLQASLIKTTATKQFGVPFVYHHIVHTMCTIYLMVQSLASLFVETDSGYTSYWPLLSYPITCFVILGAHASLYAMVSTYWKHSGVYALPVVLVLTRWAARHAERCRRHGGSVRRRRVRLQPGGYCSADCPWLSQREGDRPPTRREGLLQHVCGMIAFAVLDGTQL